MASGKYVRFEIIAAHTASFPVIPDTPRAIVDIYNPEDASNTLALDGCGDIRLGGHGREKGVLGGVDMQQL